MALLGTLALNSNIRLVTWRVKDSDVVGKYQIDIEFWWYDGTVKVTRSVAVLVGKSSEPGDINDNGIQAVNDAYGDYYLGEQWAQ